MKSCNAKWRSNENGEKTTRSKGPVNIFVKGARRVKKKRGSRLFQIG